MCRIQHKVPIWAASLVILSVGVPWTHAADKNGVSPTTISRPSGPGSLEGLGESFQPALNTGTAHYEVKFNVPSGVTGHTPDLSLVYDSGRGDGSVGIGWECGTGSIRRRSDKGIPRYGSSDLFLGMEGEELIPTVNGYCLAKIQRAFIRYARSGDAWVGHLPDGTRLDFGLTPAARVTDASGARIYTWCLEKQTDTNGNVIEYHYSEFSDSANQKYLTEIRYGPGAGPWSNYYSVILTYEPRPDWVKDYRSGFEIRTGRRLSQIDIRYNSTLIRRYLLAYEAHPHWSLLTSVTQYGDDGVTALPTTTFNYNVFEPPSTISAAGSVIGSVGEPVQVMDSSIVELADMNADGLPDLLQTLTAGGGHRAFLNQGVQGCGIDAAIHWAGPFDVDTPDATATQFDLSQPQVHLADMDGDSLSDLVHTTAGGEVHYYRNEGSQGNPAWGLRQDMTAQDTSPPSPFGTANVRTADLDFDKRIDIVKSSSANYAIWFNRGHGFYSEETRTPGAQQDGTVIQFGDVGTRLTDMNGDRIIDVAKISATRLTYCAGMGHGFFDEAIDILIPDQVLTTGTGGQVERAQLMDLNNDGLADLVIERAVPGELWYWINLGNDQFSTLHTITGLPASYGPNTVTRWADMNGNGTTDLVYADSDNEPRLRIVDIGEIIAGSAFRNAVTSIDNGYGRRMTIHYRSTTDYYVEATTTGHPWMMSLPFPTTVVSRVETTFGLDLDGFSDSDPMATIAVPAGQDIYITQTDRFYPARSFSRRRSTGRS